MRRKLKVGTTHVCLRLYINSEQLDEPRACIDRHKAIFFVVNFIPILPPDLVDNELSDECDNNVDSPPSNQIHSSDENNELWTIKDDIEETEEKVGRWTLSSGASKNVSKIKSSARNKKHSKPTNMEEERLQIYSESQRLVREADVHLPVHRPKQFKCFSEFRQSLKGCKSNETKSCETSSQNKLHSDCSTHFQPIPGQSTRNEETENELDIKPFVSQGYSIDHPVDIDCTTLEPPPMSSDAKPSLDVTSEPDVLTNLLPRLDARKLKNDEREELFIDLGESIPTSTSSVTPSQLLARLKSHLHVSHEKVVRGPIQYSIITKVQSSDAEREELQVETVTHEPSKGLSTTISVSRKHWLEHRKVLEEKMRQKRLEQYEMRLKEEGTWLKSTNENTGEVSNSDEEWSEGVANDSEISDEDSNAEEESSSDSESEEEEGEENESLDDDEEDDNVVVGSKKASRQRPCLFADDEAEESENDEVFAEADDPEDEEALTCKDCADIKQNKSCSKTTGVNNLNVDFGKNIARSHTPQKQHLQLDDFTDLPQETTGFKLFSSCNNGYSLGLPQRHHHGTLGPADIDLFASECSSILDRTMNPQSILASTRLDATTIGDENKSRFTRNSSTHSQWNNTPYELLYSQKPNSQLHSQVHHENRHNLFGGSLCDESQAVMDSVTTKSFDENDDIDSQVRHNDRCNLFGGSISNQSQELVDGTAKSITGGYVTDSQTNHDNHRILFGGSISTQSQAFMDLAGDNDDLDSQIQHEKHGNLFSGSICVQSQESINEVKNSIINNNPADSHENRRNLFGESTCDQSQGHVDEILKSPVNNHDDPDFQESEHPISGFTTQNSSRRRVLVFDDEDDEEEGNKEKKDNSFIEPSSLIRNNPFKSTSEAELSGDENERAYFMDDEDELDPNDDDANEEFADLIDEDDSDIPSAGRLRRQIERVHHRLQTDQDLRELRYLKELYFEDGDLHAENGRVRQRRFRWRGLDNNDPFTDQINIDNSDDNSSEDEKHGIPCGPIDNWLRRGPMKSSNGENNQSTENGDLDSDTIHSSSNKQTNDKDPSDSALESDEEIENSKAVTDNLSTGVLSLGKKALLKSQTKLQTQIVVCNKLPSNRTTKSASTLRNPLFSNYFLQPKSHNLPINEGVTNDTDSNSKVDSVIVSTNNNDKPIAPVKFNNVNNAVNDVRFQTIRRGSLLSRFAGGLVPGYKSEPTQIHSNVNDGFDAGTSKSESRRDQTHLDLRSKVGLSCFSVVTAQIKPEKTDSFDDGASNQKSLKSCDFPIKQKRPVDVIKPNSVLLSPPSLKRHRSTSVFNALL
ncbi:claspin-like protein [Schistosoma mansoni]|uniref:claspin-like protein n=1 Tax=Schistosoma mansoni TaxID=6183 RepID=UPI00022DC015|nr:claspin-like protein [Schistosoma mansoni]|eukprot:XP_018650473.1 claspin-like protein [Schistosoma mansoni]